jgi:hypothetical protein
MSRPARPDAPLGSRTPTPPAPGGTDAAGSDTGSSGTGTAGLLGRAAPTMARVAAVLFPEPPPLPRSGAAGRVLGGLALAVAAAVVFVRRLPSGTWDKVWAEDGYVFLADALRLPWWQTVLRPYAGYPHLFPRLTAEVAAALPLDSAPYVFIVASGALVAAVAWSTWRLSAAHLPSPALRLVLVAALVLVPGGGLEATGNVSNSHFYLLLGALWALLGRSRSAAVVVVATVLVGLATLTEPFSLLLLPLVVARAVALRGWRDRAVVVTWAAGSVVQLAVVLTQHRSTGGTTGPGHVLFGYLFRVVSTTFAGVSGPGALTAHGSRGAVVTIGIAGLLLLVGAGVVAGPRRPLVAAAAAFSVVCFVLPCLFNLPGGTFPPTGPAEFNLTLGGRYTIAPSLLLLTGLLLAAQTVLERRPRAGVAAVVAVVVPVVVWAAIDYRPAPTLRSAAADWADSLDAVRAACAEDPAARPPAVPLEPGGPWLLDVSCAQAAR